jgi:hypothetical protein
VVGISRAYATQTVAKPEVGRSIAGLRNTQASSESEFSFLAVPIVLDLGYSVWIEHEGLQKYFTYDPTEGVSQQAREPVSLAAASPLSGIINPVVNPVSHMGSLERANVGQGMQGASSSAASPMQMMAPAAGTFVWEGAWDTSNGPMILEQEGPLVRGSLGEDRMMLSGKVAGERLVGTFEDDSGDMGSIDLTPTVDRMSFTGTLRYAGETDAEQWEGTLVSPLARKGIVADPKTLEGVWSTDWGVLVLDADAGSYRGMFSAECVEIQARFSSGVLQGTLFNGTTGEEGSLRLSFDRERKSFTGYYGYGDEEPTPWDGWRLR